jgi:hypothetical protein
MDRVTTCFTPRMGTAMLCSLALSLPALASPPFSKVLPANRPVMAGESFHAGTSRPSHLDLRAPFAGELTGIAAGKSTSESASTEEEPRRFPSVHHGDAANGDRNSPQAPDFGADHARIMGRAEAFAQRFHREGLPVARLWENHSALLSLGLNQKGKPGLWLVQKTH